MKVEVYGGRLDGAVINIADGSTTYVFVEPSTTVTVSSPFDPLPVQWLVMKKMHHSNSHVYPVVIHPRFRAWILKHQKKAT